MSCRTRSPAPGEVVVELKAAALNRRDTYLRKGANPTYHFPLPLVLGSDGAGIRRDTGEEVVIFPMLRLGRPRGGAGARLTRSSAARATGPTRSSIAVPAENVYPEAETALLARSRRVSARRADRAPRPVLPRRPPCRRDRPRARGGQRRLDDRGLARAPGRGARPRHLVERREDRAGKGARGGGRCRLHGRRLGRRGARARGRRGRRRRRRLGRIDVARLAALPPPGRAARRSSGPPPVRRSSSRCGRSTSASSRSSARRWGARRTSRRSCGRSTRATWAPVIDSVRPLAEAAAAHERIEAGEHFGKLVLSIA